MFQILTFMGFIIPSSVDWLTKRNAIIENEINGHFNTMLPFFFSSCFICVTYLFILKLWTFFSDFVLHKAKIKREKICRSRHLYNRNNATARLGHCAKHNMIFCFLLNGYDFYYLFIRSYCMKFLFFIFYFVCLINKILFSCVLTWTKEEKKKFAMFLFLFLAAA